MGDLVEQLRAMWDGLSVADLPTLDEAATLIETQEARIVELEQALNNTHRLAATARDRLSSKDECAPTEIHDIVRASRPVPAVRALNGGE